MFYKRQTYTPYELNCDSKLPLEMTRFLEMSTDSPRSLHIFEGGLLIVSIEKLNHGMAFTYNIIQSKCLAILP